MAATARGGEAAVALAFTADMYRKLFPSEYVRACLERGVRADSRAPAAARAVELQLGVVQTAASSSLVKMGSTSVVAAVKLAVGTPAVATPDQGEVAIQVHLSPLCSTRFAVGRPSEEAQSISSQLNRVIVGSRVVEMADLSIEKGKSAWKLLLDVYCVDHDGNVADAALIAAIAALKSLRLPAVSINDTDHVVSIVPDGESAPLRLQHSAFGTSFAVVHGSVLIDPTSDEETQAASTFTVTYTSDGRLCGVHKPGGATLEPAQLHECMQVAKARSRELEALVAARLVAG